MKKWIAILLVPTSLLAADSVVTYWAKNQMTADNRDARVMRALATVMLNEVNNIRTNMSPPLTARTGAQLRNAIWAELDNQP